MFILIYEYTFFVVTHSQALQSLTFIVLNIIGPNSREKIRKNCDSKGKRQSIIGDVKVFVRLFSVFNLKSPVKLVPH